MDETTARLALLHLKNLHRNLVADLLRVTGSAAAILSGDIPPPGIVGFSRGHRRELQRLIQSDMIGRERDILDRLSIHIMTVTDGAYPRLLAHIPDPPPLLCVRGVLTGGDDHAIAVVGTRRPSEYGRKVASVLAGELAGRGYTVVSGLAVGIDGEAHRAALQKNGRTIAVLGCGHAIDYPKQHRELAERIKSHGALLSEFPPLTAPHPGNFPRRNRIISGLCHGVVVVEAGLRSGALITAHAALEQGREVFAVPGPVLSDGSRGTHDLIKNGAALVSDVEDILAELPEYARLQPDGVVTAEPLQFTPDQELVWSGIDVEPVDIDSLVRRCGLSAARVLAALMELELSGIVKELPGKRFSRSGRR